jgi:methylmalonyl-CoA mutase N-terminal domain/subunit
MRRVVKQRVAWMPPDALRRAAEAKENALRAYATVGEICDTFRSVFGSYTEPSVL